jgi:hypothetical protein
MTRKLAARFFGLIAIGTALPLAGADDLVDFQPGGYIHVDNSYGYLTVEGWDESKVEVIVTKSPDRSGQIRVVTDRRSDKELAPRAARLPPGGSSRLWLRIGERRAGRHRGG